MPWDQLSAEQRRSVTLQLDQQHDPAMDKINTFWFEFPERKRVLETQIADWQASVASTTGELALRESRLTELHRELARMESRQRRHEPVYEPTPQMPVEQSDGSSASRGAPVEYVAYPRALHQLADRLGATPEEMAAWIFAGPDDGGIAAYLNANELDPPPRFHFSLGNYGDGGNDHDYVAPLMACWFTADALARFEPGHRYITGNALIARWSDQPGLKAEAFVLAKIRESRLSDLHPIYGFTQGTSPAEASSPPLSSGLFKLSEVEQIEAEDFPEGLVAGDRSAAALLQTGAGAIKVASGAGAAEPAMTVDAQELPADLAEGKGDEGSAAGSCGVFRAMPGLIAEELTIAFVGDKAESGLGANNMLKISAREVVRTVPLAALDLVDRRRGTLNSQGVILLGMVSGRRLPPKRAHAQKLTRLRQLFKTHLGLADPFHPYSESAGWALRFRLEDRRGAADERAKQEAERRTVSLEQLAGRGFMPDDRHQAHRSFDAEGDTTDVWLKENDAEGSS